MTRRIVRAPELWLLTAVVVFGFAVRAYHLGSFPNTFLADEADNSENALQILHGQAPANGLFGLDWTQQPAFSVYVQSAFFRVFGASVTTARLPSAVLTALALIPFYFLLRRCLSSTSAMLTTFLLATNVWYLNFSRSAWNNAYVCLFLLTAMLFLLRGVDDVRNDGAATWRTAADFGASGFFCALGLYGYPSGRAIVVGTFLFLPVAVWYCRERWKKLLIGYAVLALVTVVVVLPLGIYAARNWSFFNGRTNTVAITRTPQFHADALGTMWAQIRRNVRGPWDGSVNNTPQYTPPGEPQLDSFTGALVAAGMVLSFLLPKVRRQPGTWLCWIMLLVAWMITQLLTAGSPNGARGVVYVPILLYFAGVAVEATLVLTRWLFRSRPSRTWATRAVSAAGAAAILSAGSLNLDHYVSWQRDPRTRQARWIYLQTREFPAWATAVVERADAGEAGFNVGQWRATHRLPSG